MEAPDSVAADRAQGQSTTDAAIVTPSRADGNRDDDKEFARLAAVAALTGCGLYRLADGDLLLTKWGMARTCPDLRSVAALLARLGGAA